MKNIELLLTLDQANYVVNCINENIKTEGIKTAQTGLDIVKMMVSQQPEEVVAEDEEEAAEAAE